MLKTSFSMNILCQLRTLYETTFCSITSNRVDKSDPFRANIAKNERKRNQNRENETEFSRKKPQ
jgi:hypothetical protein